MIITYTYDPFNRRTSKTDNDTHWQSYIYEPDSFRPLALIKGNAQQDKIQRYWYQNDQLGTPIRLTDSTGETLYQCEYNAYGQVIDENYYCDNIDSLPDNPLCFQGQYYDEDKSVGFVKYETGYAARNAYQIKGPEIGTDINGVGSWSDARLLGEFDTLQLFKNGVPQVRVPNWAGDTVKGKLEPFAEAYPQYGSGGATQLYVDHLIIKFKTVKILPEK